MSVNISFFITGGDTSPCLFEVIDSIESAINDYPIKYTYEILLVSFEEVKYKNVIWIEDKLKQPGHVVQAVNSLVPHCTGEYILALPDDHKFPNSKPLRVIEWMESDFFKNRKYKVSGIGAGVGTLSDANKLSATAIPNVDLWYSNPERFPDHAAFPEELKDPRFCTTDHRYMIVGYPAYSRETLLEHFGGYYFNPSFKHHWADNWLPFFVGETDGYTLVCEDTPFQWCPRPASAGGGSVETYDLEDYMTWCKLCVKLLKEGCSYYEKVYPDPSMTPGYPSVVERVELAGLSPNDPYFAHSKFFAGNMTGNAVFEKGKWQASKTGTHGNWYYPGNRQEPIFTPFHQV